MQRSVNRTEAQKYLILAAVAALVLLVLSALWLANRDKVGPATTRDGGSEITLPIDKTQAGDIATVHTRAR